MNKARRTEIAKVITSIEELKASAATLAGQLSDIKDSIEQIRDDEQEYYDNMPDNMRDGDKGEAAQSAVNALEEAMSGVETMIAELDESKFSDIIGDLDESTAS